MKPTTTPSTSNPKQMSRADVKQQFRNQVVDTFAVNYPEATLGHVNNVAEMLTNAFFSGYEQGDKNGPTERLTNEQKDVIVEMANTLGPRIERLTPSEIADWDAKDGSTLDVDFSTCLAFATYFPWATTVKRG